MKVVWLAEVKWAYLKTRKQQIITRRPRDVELLYVEPYVRGAPNDYTVREENGLGRVTVPFLKSPPNFFWRVVLWPSSTRGIVTHIASRKLRRILAERGFEGDDVAVVISNIYAVGALAGMRRRVVVYDCNDAHDAFPGMPGWTGRYFLETARTADAVVASSRVLKERLDELRGRSDTVLIGNGVDLGNFESKPGASPSGARPVLGYLGAVAPWLDFDLIADLAVAHGEWDIVLVGPVLGGAGRELARVLDLPNVSHRPPVPHEEVPRVLASFSLALIPFRINELTRGVNPNKLYEYLAAGLPVVTTDFSFEVKVHPEVVKAVGRAEFVRACEEFLDSDGGMPGRNLLAARAREIASEYDWGAIAARFWEHVKNLMTKA